MLSFFNFSYISVIDTILSDMLTTNNHDDDDEEEEEEEISDNEQDEEQVNVLEPVQGLFSSQVFPNVIEMFQKYQAQFNLMDFLRTHQIDSQYDYIRLINYIRREVIPVINRQMYKEQHLSLI